MVLQIPERFDSELDGMRLSYMPTVAFGHTPMPTARVLVGEP
jgi:hypothetical protein